MRFTARGVKRKLDCGMSELTVVLGILIASATSASCKSIPLCRFASDSRLSPCSQALMVLHAPKRWHILQETPQGRASAGQTVAVSPFAMYVIGLTGFDLACAESNASEFANAVSSPVAVPSGLLSCWIESLAGA